MYHTHQTPGLALISGGIPSNLNAADVQEYRNPCDEEGLTESSMELCDDLGRLRNSQTTSAVSCSYCKVLFYYALFDCISRVLMGVYVHYIMLAVQIEIVNLFFVVV